MTSADILARYRFFRSQGERAEYALMYARDEAEAEARGFAYRWQEDTDIDFDWPLTVDDSHEQRSLVAWEKRRYEQGDIEIYGCILSTPDDDHAQSLWGIQILVADFHYGRAPYQRVIEAELAHEQLHEERRKDALVADINRQLAEV